VRQRVKWDGRKEIRKVWSLIIRSSSEDRREQILKPGRNALGRRADNDIILQDSAASGYHAEIHYDSTYDTITIRDLESTNGTFVNSKRIYDYQILHHEDHIRIGVCLITLISSEIQSPDNPSTIRARTRVTSELILESVDNYGVLLHEVGQRLVNMPDLDNALFEITELIKRMIGAEECEVILADIFDRLEEKGIPASVVQATVRNQSANIFSDDYEDAVEGKGNVSQAAQSILLVPVLIDGDVVALIFSRKSIHSSYSFHNSDLQLVLAISNQVAMSIQRHRIEGKLRHNSNHDALTDLPNRSLFLDRLGDSVANAKQQKGTEFAVLFFDIDDFKIVNDSLGHAVGDKLLVAIADRLRHNVRKIDTVARAPVISRFGGDEFAILLDDIKEGRFALAAATRLKELMSKPYKIDGKEIFATLSIGVAMSTHDYEQPEDILRDADIAMYRAKELGKERVEVYDKAMHARILKRMHIGNALRQGALQKEFRLHYQPIISLQDGHIVGHEALIRWYTPDGGILEPDDFLDAMDTAGLLYKTDHWVLQNACLQAVEWHNQFPGDPPLFMSVNISAKYFRHPNLVDDIDQVLQKTKLDPNRLWLEITEKVSAADDESAITIIRKLRSMGIRISLDDFGTGYSALNYLARFPVDALKIDKSFIKMIGVQEESLKIIEMIKALADHLGLILIAEGVEDAKQIPFLRSINCEYAQGFYFAKPMDSQSATRLLAQGKQW
jgi:diguanylate cyclase (GGDEF)-like protein